MIGIATVISIKVIMLCMAILALGKLKRNSDAKTEKLKNPSFTFGVQQSDTCQIVTNLSELSLPT